VAIHTHTSDNHCILVSEKHKNWKQKRWLAPDFSYHRIKRDAWHVTHTDIHRSILHRVSLALQSWPTELQPANCGTRHRTTGLRSTRTVSQTIETYSISCAPGTAVFLIVSLWARSKRPPSRCLDPDNRLATFSSTSFLMQLDVCGFLSTPPE
jgi:hypothetical protein